MKPMKSTPAMTLSTDPAENQPLKGSDDDSYTEQPKKARASKNNNSDTDVLLARICDLMETRLRSVAEERAKADVDEEIKNDWMLAAAVIDRILFFMFSCLFVGSTTLFFVIFLLMP